MPVQSTGPAANLLCPIWTCDAIDSLYGNLCNSKNGRIRLVEQNTYGVVKFKYSSRSIKLKLPPRRSSKLTSDYLWKQRNLCRIFKSSHQNNHLAPSMKIIKSVLEMMNISNLERAKGKLIRLVPTMGALHRGHAFLMKVAAKETRITDQDLRSANLTDAKLGRPEQVSERDSIVIVVSIFVNPLQFNNPEDFTKYPNSLQADLDACERLEVDYVFVPGLKEIYPDIDSGADQCMICPADFLANTLEGKSRPGHFKGMLTVVCKLFNITRPHEAYFGEKDYQQLLLVEKMSRDLNMGIRIVPVETVRDCDMLPLSSRNVRLTQIQRQIAPLMYKILLDAKQAIESCHKRQASNSGDELRNFSSILAASMIVSLNLTTESGEAESIMVDYLELRCSRDLGDLRYNQESGCFDCNGGCVTQQVTGERVKAFRARLLISVIIGNVRLLDNIEVLLNT